MFTFGEKKTAKAVVVARARPLVLTVDDDPSIRALLKQILERLGLDVVVAETGSEAYRIALRDVPDLVITDYSMPDGTGEYLMIRLQETEETSQIPVLVLTSMSTSTDRDYALERRINGQRGAAGFLSKPVDVGALVVAVRKHVRTNDKQIGAPAAVPGAAAVPVHKTDYEAAARWAAARAALRRGQS